MLMQGGWEERAGRAFIHINNRLDPLDFLTDLYALACAFCSIMFALVNYFLYA